MICMLIIIGSAMIVIIIQSSSKQFIVTRMRKMIGQKLKIQDARNASNLGMLITTAAAYVYVHIFVRIVTVGIRWRDTCRVTIADI